ncbi:nitroreductase/quinone reductase family protein [Nocardia jejuensis]|uniref:nitroreductase/quinone reductase family protein n=1 Tax=Nocardia jejuensis TaxID=328049 RepID=UPI0008362CF1|nr:nitroreductase/quinone reductase family protein [Nocardia jejuensis]
MGDKQKTPDWVAESGAWVLENGHRTLLTLTGGRWPHKLGSMHALELHTIGRKTGQRRATLLSTPILTAERIVLIASLGGASHNPAWYLNLVACPDIEITVRGETKPYIARTASPEEKAELWPEITRGFGNPYDGYQRSTTRDIPVVICEPA